MKLIASMGGLLLTIAASNVIGDTVKKKPAEPIKIAINLVSAEGIGKEVGDITVTDSKFGVVFTPSLNGLVPGLHGFHVHMNPSCAPKERNGKAVAALSAGGHYDPKETGKHGTPWGDGHLGDLPGLFVDAEGNATQPVLAPRLKVEDLKGRAVMLHMGGDNHSDNPAKLGGGGARMACGVSK